MGKEILFIDGRQSFVVKGISTKFEKDGYKCSLVPLDVNEIKSVENAGQFAEFVFMCVYEDAQNYVDTYKAIKEMCIGKNRKLFFLGFEEDLEKVIPIFPDNMVAGQFKRPANAAQVAEELNNIINNGSGKNAKKHILIVDDSGTLLNAIKEWLDDEYRVSMANSAVNALFLMATTLPDLILLDYAMPVCDGPQLFRMLRSEARTKNVPVIFLTGMEDEDVRDNALDLNPDGYMLKSMSREGILAQIEAFFDNREMNS